MGSSAFAKGNGAGRQDVAGGGSAGALADEALTLAVRNHYARLARRARGVEARAGSGSASCCQSTCSPAAMGYGTDELAHLPEPALAASAGCGNPVGLAGLRPGEVVLDLGSGGGLDALVAARRVGPQGFVWGVDMTDEMVELAEENRRRSGLDNVRFVRGRIEALPLPDACVDVVISNCVINLSVDKEAVLRETARVLRPGGRVAIYDMVAPRPLPGRLREDMSAWSACLAGAIDIETYRRLLDRTGFIDIQVKLAAPPPGGCCDSTEETQVRPAFVSARKPPA